MQELESSSVVFKGRAIEIKNEGLTIFQVEEAWKGVEEAHIEIYDNGWDPYSVKTDYLVFGSLRDGELRTNLCGRTGPWDNTREEAMNKTGIQSAEFFNNEVPPTTNGHLERSWSQTEAVILVIFTFLIILSLIVVWRRKRRPPR
ncbi:hypothetical protein AB6A23_04195 [Paenibacillus tarimensis]